MSAKYDTKLKLLYIKDFLERKSDEEHPVSAEEIIDMLRENDIECERKSVYSDIGILKNFGMDIDLVKSPKNGYRLLSREFELPELRLLIDAIQAANFITPKKTKELIKKINSLCSDHQLEILDGQVHIENRVKCTNEEIYYNIDKIERAIRLNRQISFIYRKRKFGGSNQEVVTQDKEFIVNPYAMIWSNDHYYLVGNNPKYDNLMHTRIDRMKSVEILEEKERNFSEVSEYKRFFDSADYSKKIFNMFSGDIQHLELRCNNSIIEEILDRFGTETSLIKDSKDDCFRLSTKCVISEGLISWILQFGNNIEVVEPESLRNQIVEKIECISELYL